MMMMNCFCGIVDRRKAISLISSRDHCQRSSLSRISDTPRAVFEPVPNLSSGLVEWSCAVVITITPRRHYQLGRSIVFFWWTLALFLEISWTDKPLVSKQQRDNPYSVRTICYIDVSYHIILKLHPILAIIPPYIYARLALA